MSHETACVEKAMYQSGWSVMLQLTWTYTKHMNIYCSLMFWQVQIKEFCWWWGTCDRLVCEHKGQFLWQYIKYQSLLVYYFANVCSRLLYRLFYCSFSSHFAFPSVVVLTFSNCCVLFLFVCKMSAFLAFLFSLVILFIMCVRFVPYKYKDNWSNIFSYFVYGLFHKVKTIQKRKTAGREETCSVMKLLCPAWIFFFCSSSSFLLFLLLFFQIST